MSPRNPEVFFDKLHQERKVKDARRQELVQKAEEMGQMSFSPQIGFKARKVSSIMGSSKSTK